MTILEESLCASPKRARHPSKTRCGSSIRSTSAISERRQVNLHLNQFRALSFNNDEASYQNFATSESSTHFAVTHNSQLPLTPPSEKDFTCLWPGEPGVSKQLSKTNDQEVTIPHLHDIRDEEQRSPNGNAQETVLNSNVGTLESSPSNTWLLNTIRIATNSLQDNAPMASIKMISQVLPSCGQDRRLTKTYEVACEHFQSILPEPRFISIYHALALSEGQAIQDLPRSPPSTPSAFGADGYFDSQSIFYHFTQVPLYHEVNGSSKSTSPPPQRNMLPPEANLIILERYIPPTTPAEFRDFFDANSGRSSLVDRMAELHLDAGSLLLIYPTQRGAETFSRKCIGPVLDPLLRQLVIIRGLGSDAAERLGRQKAISAMLDQQGMAQKISTLCAAMNVRSDIRNTRSSFTLVHNQVVSVAVSASTWMTWFIDQEHQRFKQDLIDYHMNGGAMPQGESRNSELTPGMLVRQVITDLQKSKPMDDGPELEIGVFVVRRSRNHTSIP